METNAYSGSLYAYISVMLFNYTVYGGESKSGSFSHLFGGEERIKICSLTASSIPVPVSVKIKIMYFPGLPSPRCP